MKTEKHTLSVVKFNQYHCVKVFFLMIYSYQTYISVPLQKSSGFVYGVCALMDKISLGFIVFGLQENYPETKG